MEMEQRTSLTNKKLWGITRVILDMLKKRLLKNIPWYELHMILKRSTKLAGKLIGNLLFHYQTLTCRPNNTHTTFIAPIEYEFSCSNNPLFHTKRKHNGQYYYSAGNRGLYRRSHNNNNNSKDHELTVNNVRKVFDVLNSYEVDTLVTPEKSPLTMLGFGESPNVRQLRVTDSPFPENNREDEDTLLVDKAAEEFINNFYKELKQQKERAAVDLQSR